MEIGLYKAGLGDSGTILFEKLRERYKLKELKDLILLRAASEAWETMLVSREQINDPNFKGAKPHAINKAARGQLITSIDKLALWSKRKIE